MSFSNRKSPFFAVLLILLFWSTPFCHAKSGPNDPRINVSAFTLENGMQFLVVERHTTPQVACRLAIRAGSALEEQGKTGIAHLLEHMMFKGTANFGTLNPERDRELQEKIESAYQAIAAEQRKRKPDQSVIRARLAEMEALRREVQEIYVPQAISSQLGKNGAVGVNAFTSKDQTQYMASVPSDMLEQWFSIMSEQLFEPSWREFYVEREVVQREWAFRYVNNPQGAAWLDLESTAYRAHPYRNPTIGWKSDMEKLSTTDAMAFHKKYYTPNNTVCVLVGDLTVDQARRFAETYFERYPKGQTAPESVTRDAQQQGERMSVRYLKGARTPVVFLGFRGADIGTDDFYALDALTMVLSQGRSARLTQEITDKGLAVSAWSSNPDNRYGGLFILGGSPHEPEEVRKGGLSEEEQRVAYLKACEGLEKLLLEKAEELKKTLVSSEELGADQEAQPPRLPGKAAGKRRARPDPGHHGGHHRVGISEHLPRKNREGHPRGCKACGGQISADREQDECVRRPWRRIRTPGRALHGDALPGDDRGLEDGGAEILRKPFGLQDPRRVEAPPFLRPNTTEDPIPRRIDFHRGGSAALLHVRPGAAAHRSHDIREGRGRGRREREARPHAHPFRHPGPGGTEKTPPARMAAILDENAIHLSVSVQEEDAAIRLSVMKEDWEKGMALLEEVLTRPGFDPQILEVLKRQAVTGLRRQAGDAQALSVREGLIWHFRNHPYGRDPLLGLETIPRLTREDLQTFLKGYFVPSNMVACIAGDIDRETAEKSLGRLFGALPQADAPPRNLSDPAATPPVVALIHKPGQVQSQVFLVLPGIKRTHPDFWKMGLLTSIFGGSESLMYTKLRDDLGLVYSAGMHQTYKWQAGLLAGSIGCKADKTADAIEETVRLMKEASRDLPEERIEEKRLDALNSFVFNVDTPLELVETYGRYRMRKEPLDTLSRIQDAYMEARKQELLTLAGKHLDSTRLQVFITADKEIPVKTADGKETTLEEAVRSLAQRLSLPYKEIPLR